MFMNVAGPLPILGLGCVPAETGDTSSGYGRGVLGGKGGGPPGCDGGGGGAEVGGGEYDSVEGRGGGYAGEIGLEGMLLL